MKDKHYCQSCGMPLSSPKFMGTEYDGSVNPDYCIYCYLHGEFTKPSITLDEMKALVKEKMGKMNAGQNAIDTALNNLPGLKRWKPQKVLA